MTEPPMNGRPGRGQKTSGQTVGVLLVLLAAAVFAVNGTASKLVLEQGLSALRLVELRCAGAALVFTAVAAVRRPASLRATWAEVPFMAAYGIAGVALVQWLYLVAIARMPVSITLLLEFTAPLLVALWVRFVRGEQVRPRIWLALVLVLGGLALVARVWAGLTLDALGVGAALAAAVALAAYYLLGERGLGRRDPLSLSAWSFGAAALFWSVLQPWWSFPWHLLGRTASIGVDALGPGTVDVPLWTLVLYVVVFGTVLPFALVLAGINRIGPTRTGLVGTSEPVMAGLVAWFVLGEVLVAVQIVGVVVVLSGILLAETARRPGVAMSPETPAPLAAGRGGR